MTPALAVAAGTEAVDSLFRLCETSLAAGALCFTRHSDLAVAWPGSPWIDTFDDGEVLVVLDGRLHNLVSCDASPAELLSRRYRSRRVDVARGLLGDFVAIVLDRRHRTLLVARDPVGVRPWYQATASRHCAGASDLVTLAALPWVDTSTNEHIAIEYLAAVEESRGETLYSGIRTLPPGQTWYRTPGATRLFSHHRWELEPELEISWENAAQRCRDVLDEAVRCRLAVSGAATSELSGGLDSSSVVGTVVRLGRKDLVVGRLVFDTPRADERVYSDAVIDYWGLRAVSATPWIPSGAELDSFARDVGRPCPDANFTMFVTLHRLLSREGRPDGLTGLGGDDAFVVQGIGSRVVSAVKLRQAAVLKSLARQVITRPGRSWSDVLRPTLGYLVAPWRNRGSPRWVSRAAAARADLSRLARRRPARVTGIDAIDERLGTFTSGYNAAILETRAVVSDWVGRRESHPFLDPRFVQATYGLDPSWPATGGHYRALQVEAFRDRLPPAVAARRTKADFSEVFWPQVLDDAGLALIRRGPLGTLGWLDSEGFDALVADAKRGMANAAIPLFRCVSVDRWLRSQ